MGGITRKKQSIGIITGSDDDEEVISYCPRCEKQDYLSILQERVYLPDQPIPSDHELWKQCHHCGQLVPVHELKKESKLQDFVQVSSNPFDSKKAVVGLGNKKPKDRRQKELDKIRERIDMEKDPDIKRELRRGNLVKLIEESIDY
ncbi:MAG: hypothetical protein ACR2KF_08595 [Nitrososphaeraceae archaeon]